MCETPNGASDKLLESSYECLQANEPKFVSQRNYRDDIALEATVCFYRT
jgi:hypothetical protein